MSKLPELLNLLIVAVPAVGTMGDTPFVDEQHHTIDEPFGLHSLFLFCRSGCSLRVNLLLRMGEHSSICLEKAFVQFAHFGYTEKEDPTGDCTHVGGVCPPNQKKINGIIVPTDRSNIDVWETSRQGSHNWLIGGGRADRSSMGSAKRGETSPCKGAKGIRMYPCDTVKVDSYEGGKKSPRIYAFPFFPTLQCQPRCVVCKNCGADYAAPSGSHPKGGGC